jgi:putative DNA primase/helicase
MNGNEGFLEALRAAGVDPGDTPIIQDGKLHRYCGPDDGRDRKNCWYVLFEHGGAFGSWRLGINQTWYPQNGRKPNKQEREEIEGARRKAEAGRKAGQDDAAAKAETIWSETLPVTEPSEYLVRKHIQPHCARLYDQALCIPIYELGTQRLVSVQFIHPDGSKVFLKGGRVAGCYCPLPDSWDRDYAAIAIAEGFATAASIQEASGLPVAIAFSAGNLLALAKDLRKKHRSARLILCADDDRGIDGNPGLTKAQEAARVVAGVVVVPAFPEGIEGTDFNDLACKVGADAVREQILAAIRVGIPANFQLTSDGVYLLRAGKTKGGKPEIEQIPVCSRLEVIALSRDNTSGEWGRVLHFTDSDRVAHQWSLPMRMLAGDGTEYRERLLEQGLTIAPSRDARHALHEYISECRPAARARAVVRLGWHERLFVLPDAVFGESDETVLYQNALELPHVFNQRGSLKDWQRNVAALCENNSRLVFAVSAAFAAPLLALTGDESGGFNIVGPSSIGKTTMLHASGSVWGGSDTQAAGYLRSWRATGNGLEGVAVLHRDTLLCLDELSQVSALEAGSIAYMLANGLGKARARRDGAARQASDWRLLFLSSGEITLADKLREERRRATGGQLVRVLDFPADAGQGLGLFEDLHGEVRSEGFADHLREASHLYYGSAARAFLAELVSRDQEELVATLRGFRDSFIAEHCPAGADAQVSRAAARFALVGAAGSLATALGITGWDSETALWAAGVCIAAWLSRRGHLGPADIEAGIEQVRTFIQLHGSARFATAEGKERPVPNRVGFRADDCYCIYPEVFRSEILAGWDWRVIADAMVKRELILPGKDGKVQRVVRDPESNKTIRMICVAAKIVGLEDEEEEKHEGE